MPIRDFSTADHPVDSSGRPVHERGRIGGVRVLLIGRDLSSLSLSPSVKRGRLDAIINWPEGQQRLPTPKTVDSAAEEVSVEELCLCIAGQVAPPEPDPGKWEDRLHKLAGLRRRSIGQTRACRVTARELRAMADIVRPGR
jgi:hypothetical protein